MVLSFHFSLQELCNSPSRAFCVVKLSLRLFGSWISLYTTIKKPLCWEVLFPTPHLGDLQGDSSQLDTVDVWATNGQNRPDRFSIFNKGTNKNEVTSYLISALMFKLINTGRSWMNCCKTLHSLSVQLHMKNRECKRKWISLTKSCF